MRHCKAIAARAANSTAFRFSTGKAPGSPKHTGHTFVLGGSPKRVEHEQKIFDTVSSCTWTSSPMTGSYFASKSSETAGVVAISRDYKWRGQGPGSRALVAYRLQRETTSARKATNVMQINKMPKNFTKDVAAGLPSKSVRFGLFFRSGRADLNQVRKATGLATIQTPT